MRGLASGPRARDAAGYDQARYSGPDVFIIDMTTALAPPANVAVVPTLTLVSDRNIGADQFQLRLTYNTSMNTATTPVVSFSPDVASTLCFDPAESWWVSDRIYKATYNVADVDASVPSIAISTTGVHGRGI